MPPENVFSLLFLQNDVYAEFDRWMYKQIFVTSQLVRYRTSVMWKPPSDNGLHSEVEDMRKSNHFSLINQLRKGRHTVVMQTLINWFK